MWKLSVPYSFTRFSASLLTIINCWYEADKNNWFLATYIYFSRIFSFSLSSLWPFEIHSGKTVRAFLKKLLNHVTYFCVPMQFPVWFLTSFTSLALFEVITFAIVIYRYFILPQPYRLFLLRVCYSSRTILIIVTEVTLLI